MLAEGEQWARRQQKALPDKPLQAPESVGEYNIWYGKYEGDRDRTRDRATTRCVSRTDSGRTKGDFMATFPYFCIHFARGTCIKGPDCLYLHRVPTMEDAVRIDLVHDCFGRSRHATDRDDMDGVGSFNRDSRTLHVSQISRLTSADCRERLARHFGEWGELEAIAIKPKSLCAFIRFAHRVNAEFAKEAMAENHLDDGEQLRIRWAYDDPNPEAINRIKGERQDLLATAAARQIGQTPEDPYAAALAAGEYPPTDDQYYAAPTDENPEPFAYLKPKRLKETPEEKAKAEADEAAQEAAAIAADPFLQRAIATAGKAVAKTWANSGALAPETTSVAPEQSGTTAQDDGLCDPYYQEQKALYDAQYGVGAYDAYVAHYQSQYAQYSQEQMQAYATSAAAAAQAFGTGQQYAAAVKAVASTPAPIGPMSPEEEAKQAELDRLRRIAEAEQQKVYEAELERVQALDKMSALLDRIDDSVQR